MNEKLKTLLKLIADGEELQRIDYIFERGFFWADEEDGYDDRVADKDNESMSINAAYYYCRAKEILEVLDGPE